MTRFLFALPLLAACTHTPLPCDAVWPRTCEERQTERSAAIDASPPASKPVDDSNGAHSADNGGKSNGGSSDSNDENGGDS